MDKNETGSLSHPAQKSAPDGSKTHVRCETLKQEENVRRILPHMDAGND